MLAWASASRASFSACSRRSKSCFTASASALAARAISSACWISISGVGLPPFASLATPARRTSSRDFPRFLAMFSKSASSSSSSSSFAFASRAASSFSRSSAAFSFASRSSSSRSLRRRLYALRASSARRSSSEGPLGSSAGEADSWRGGSAGRSWWEPWGDSPGSDFRTCAPTERIKSS